MWDVGLVCFILGIVFGAITFSSGDEIRIFYSGFGSVIFLLAAGWLSIICWRARRALKRMNYER